MQQPSVRVYVALCGISAFLNATMFTQLTLFYVTRAGMTPLQLVLVGTFLEITAFAFQVPTGLFADVFGRRLSVVIGTLVSGAAFVFIGLAPGFGTIAAGLCVWAVGATFVSGAREAWIVDEVGQDGVAAVFLRATRARQAAGLAGAVASAALARLTLAAPIVIGGALTVALGLWLVRRMPETGFRPGPVAGRPAFGDVLAALRAGANAVRRRPTLRWFLVAGIAYGVYGESFSRLGEAHFVLHVGFASIGFLRPSDWFAVIAGGAQVLGFLAAWAASRRPGWRPAPLLAALTAAQMVSVIGFGLAPSFGIALGAYWAAGVCGTVAGPVLNAWVSAHIPSGVRATVMSMLEQADALGQLGGGPPMGALATARGTAAAMVVTGWTLLPALVFYCRSATSRAGRPAPPGEGAASSTRNL